MPNSKPNEGKVLKKLTWKKLNMFRPFGMVVKDKLVLGLSIGFFLNQISTFGKLFSFHKNNIYF